MFLLAYRVILCCFCFGLGVEKVCLFCQLFFSSNHIVANHLRRRYTELLNVFVEGMVARKKKIEI